MSDAPNYDVDFYGDDFIRDPHPHYAAMRALGPVVYLPQLGNYALTQHGAVQAALRDHARFSSASGVAGDKFGSDFLQGNTVASNPPRHTALRRAMAPPLLPGALDKIRPEVDRVAGALIEALIDAENFDAVADLARHLPLKIVTEMVGLPDFGQENMLKWAAAAFDVLGVQNARGVAALDDIAEMRAFISGKIGRDTLKPGSWTYRILDLVDQGALDPDLAPFAIRDYMNPSLDTTISATGNLIWQLANNPRQWAKLRDNPELCRNAVNEAVRLSTPIRSFTRHTTQDVDVDGVTIPKGARVMMLFASANRDPKVFENPDAFDVTRDSNAHLGFGSGIHMCIGMHLAQLEMIALLEAMIPRVGDIIVGQPDITMNNTIAAFSKLPCQFVANRKEYALPHAEHRQPDLIQVTIAARKDVATDIVALTLTPTDGDDLPPVSAGAHIDLHLQDGLVRQYSMTGRIADGYQIAVQKEPRSRGGSVMVHDRLKVGTTLQIGRPRNHIPLVKGAHHTMLLSGGIGMTPHFAMAWELYDAGRPFSWHISVRSMDRLAFAAQLDGLPFADAITVHADDAQAPNPLADLIKSHPKEAHIYICGPTGYMDFVTKTAQSAGIDTANVHTEHFGAEIDSDGEPFKIEARKSGVTLTVGPTETMLDVLTRNGIAVPTSCENGVCGSCLTPVLEGTPDHRDLVLTDVEKAENRKVAVCCSRSNTRKLVLDI